MTRARRVGLVLSLGGLLVFAGGLYQTYFAYSGAVAAVLGAIPSSERNPPPSFIAAVKRVHPAGVDGIVVRRLRAMVDPSHERHLVAATRETMWRAIFPRTHSRTEVMALYSHTLVFEAGRGLEPAAQFYFGKSAAALTDDEALAIVVMDVNPTRYSMKRYPERFKEALKRYSRRESSHFIALAARRI